jgi:LisH domain-containing protein ARMC9
MMTAFKAGKHEDFFKMWNRFIPFHLRENDSNTVKLEFYIHIYFTIYTLHPLTKKSSVGVQKEFKKRKEWFRTFLDTKGKDMSETSEFLAYYALPYIENPIDHPSFKNMFTTKWLNQITSSTEKFVSGNVMRQEKSKLQTIFAVYKKCLQDQGKDQVDHAVEIEQLSDQLVTERRKLVDTKKHLEKVRNILLQSQTKWSNFSENILKIAESFYIVMENSNVLDKVDQKWLMESTAKLSKYKKFLMDLKKEKDATDGMIDRSRGNSAIYPDRSHGEFNDESNDPNYNIGNGSFSDSRSASYVTYYKNQHDLYQLQYDTAQEERMRQYDYEEHQMEGIDDERSLPLVPLDYNKIKLFIFHSQEETKVCITLQALKWRISRSRPGNQRRHVLFAFSEYDILGCSNQENEQSLLSLLKSSPNIVLYTISLIDSLVNDNIGKKYICQQVGLIDCLFDIMKTEDGETQLRRSALVVFQKLSLGREAQSQMIKLDVIKWTVNMLKIEGNTLGDYTLEYATALLMNLSLRTQGKRKCEELDTDILKVLNELLEHENLQVRTYVNGTLYCILERKRLQEEARALNMDQVLRYLSTKSEPRFQNQIKYILTHLEEKQGNEEGDQEDLEEEDKSSDDSEDEMDELDLIDPENDMDEMDDDFSSYDEEDDELDKIQLDGEGVDQLIRGEKWLMQEFLAHNEEAIAQNHVISSRIEEYNKYREKLIEMYEKRKMDGSVHTRDDSQSDERPHMRPLTPNKIASINKSGSVFDPDSSSRHAPSEIQSRPRLKRIPPDGEHSRPSMSPISNNNSIDSPTKSLITDNNFDEPAEEKQVNGIFTDHNEEKKIIPSEDPANETLKKKTENDEKLKDPEKAAEFNEAFHAGDRIRRTPPREAKLRYLREKKQKMKQMPHLYS